MAARVTRAGGGVGFDAGRGGGGFVHRVVFVICAVLLVLLLILSWLPGVGGAPLPRGRHGNQGRRGAAEQPSVSIRRSGATEGMQARGEGYVSSHVVASEHIVQFNAYLSDDEQQRVLDDTLGLGVSQSRAITHFTQCFSFFRTHRLACTVYTRRTSALRAGMSLVVPGSHLP